MVDVTSGFETSKLLLSLSEVQFVLLHHTVGLAPPLHPQENEFPFLSNPALSHYCTLYFEALTALTLLEDIPGRLEVLSRPVTERLQRLATVQQFTDADFVVARGGRDVGRDHHGVPGSARHRERMLHQETVRGVLRLAVRV